MRWPGGPLKTRRKPACSTPSKFFAETLVGRLNAASRGEDREPERERVAPTLFELTSATVSLRNGDLRNTEPALKLNTGVGVVVDVVVVVVVMAAAVVDEETEDEVDDAAESSLCEL
jgi:hypothetical protein